MLMNDPLSELTPQESSLFLSETSKYRSVGLLKDQYGAKGIVFLMPAKAARLNEEGVHLWVQRHFGKQAAYSDLDYADAGADILEDAFSVIKAADIIAKLEPFTLQEIENMKSNQIIISSFDRNNLSVEYFKKIKEKGITAFALDFIQDMHGNEVLNDIFYRESSPMGITVSLSNLILPILEILSLNGPLKSTIQTNIALFQSLYCYNGEITRQELAQEMNLPWNDFFSHYWN